jgi:hypothetical protein
MCKALLVSCLLGKRIPEILDFQAQKQGFSSGTVFVFGCFDGHLSLKANHYTALVHLFDAVEFLGALLEKEHSVGGVHEIAFVFFASHKFTGGPIL